MMRTCHAIAQAGVGVDFFVRADEPVDRDAVFEYYGLEPLDNTDPESFLDDIRRSGEFRRGTSKVDEERFGLGDLPADGFNLGSHRRSVPSRHRTRQGSGRAELECVCNDRFDQRSCGFERHTGRFEQGQCEVERCKGEVRCCCRSSVVQRFDIVVEVERMTSQGCGEVMEH